MSAETKRRLEQALRDHVTDEADGAYLTDFAVVAAAALYDNPSATRYIHERSDSPFHTLLGLLHLGTEHLLHEDDE